MRARCLHNVCHALMADTVALLGHSGGNSPQRPALRPQRDHFADSLLLGRDLDQLAGVTAPEPEWDLPAEVAGPPNLRGRRL